jgi:hypothetical protein
MYQLKLWGVLLGKTTFVCPPEITDVHHRNQQNFLDTADFVSSQMKKIDAHIEERKARLEELVGISREYRGFERSLP